MDLLTRGQLLQTAAYDASLRHIELPHELGVVKLYVDIQTLNSALLAFQQSFKPGSPPPTPGQRETYEQFLVFKRGDLTPQLEHFRNQLVRMVG